MLISRSLDDQRYEEIVERAKGRLPWLCPAWTDHNAHDPGITILELLAWFKESQQFEMDRMTPELKRRLLSLAGLSLERERPARCALSLPADAPARPVLSRLATPEGVIFELEEPVPARRAELTSLRIEAAGIPDGAEIGGLVAGGTVFEPFRFDGREESALVLGFSRLPDTELRLWFDVAEPAGTPRNPPDGNSVPPRELLWEWAGCGPVTPAADETWSLSWSGFVTLPIPGELKRGEGERYWLRLGQRYAGCEERVRLRGVSAGRYLAVQQESRARSYRFTVPPARRQTLRIESALAGDAHVAVFLRETEGWRRAASFETDRAQAGCLTLTLDTRGAAEDGEENLLAVCLDRLHVRDLVFDAKGRPGERFPLYVEGGSVLTEQLRLMCLTLCPDGVVRPAEWRCVEDLSSAGPRDRVFAYDRQRETLVFGDGRRGALLQGGAEAVTVMDERLSLCGGGNLPAGAGLRFLSDGAPAENFAAAGGRDCETPEEGRARLLRRLQRSGRCLSAEDYERRAMETPGLRVAGAKAIPDYDRDRPHQHTQACVSVAVLPAGEDGPPLADERFLSAVSRHLNRWRSICIRVQAIPVRMVPFTAEVRLRAVHGTDPASVRQAVAVLFAPDAARIGAPARADALAAALQKLEGVLSVRQVRFQGLDQNSYQTRGGDLTVLPDMMLELKRVDVTLD